MKIVAIGDIHWRTVWKDIVAEHSDADRIVFLWDYVDSFDVSDDVMLSNLRDIIEYKKNNMEKVILLLGNHDIQYIWEWNSCSWRRENMAPIFKILFEDNIELFQCAHEEKWYLFTHAWLSTDWFAQYEEILNWMWDTIGDMLNRCLVWSSKRTCLFDVGYTRGWNKPWGWPFWADKSETEDVDYAKLSYGDISLNYITQVVWHTPVEDITILPHIIYCDTLERGSWKPLILNNL